LRSWGLRQTRRGSKAADIVQRIKCETVPLQRRSIDRPNVRPFPMDLTGNQNFRTGRQSERRVSLVLHHEYGQPEHSNPRKAHDSPPTGVDIVLEHAGAGRGYSERAKNSHQNLMCKQHYDPRSPFHTSTLEFVRLQLFLILYIFYYP
ncbi:hypothetical protein, partial [Novosphingobium malaysiense]|uniref:hypothetical protein n=1 Tax=Novosphingobium malaysiense TaxID=1348853 RepID=UPI001E5F3259